jgi:hypothetical protein
MHRVDAWRMVQRHAADLGMKTRSAATPSGQPGSPPILRVAARWKTSSSWRRTAAPLRFANESCADHALSRSHRRRRLSGQAKNKAPAEAEALGGRVGGSIQVCARSTYPSERHRLVWRRLFLKHATPPFNAATNSRKCKAEQFLNSFPPLQRQHCHRETPKSLGIFRIKSISSDTATKIVRAPVDDAGLTTILKIPPANTLELPRCCKQDRRCCALLSCLLLLRWCD